MIYLLVLFLTALIGAAIGDSKGRGAAGFFWGLLLGPLGWIIVLLGPDYKREAQEKSRDEEMRQLRAIQEAQLQELKALRAGLSSGVQIERESSSVATAVVEEPTPAENTVVEQPKSPGVGMAFVALGIGVFVMVIIVAIAMGTSN